MPRAEVRAPWTQALARMFRRIRVQAIPIPRSDVSEHVTQPIRSILAATDLTEGSDAVVRAAAGIAERTGAAYHVVHAFEMEISPFLPRGRDVPGLDEWVQASARTLDEQLERVGVHAPVSRHVAIGPAARSIGERARIVHAELIVLGRQRGDPAEAPFLGSTADRVVRTADVPCLVVSAPLSLPLRRVITPIDLSTTARAALVDALAWTARLRAPGDEVTLDVVHVVPCAFDVAGMSFDKDVVLPQMQQEIDAARAAAPAESGLKVRAQTRWGDRTAAAIIAMARDEDADLIVAATHGYGPIRRYLIGSVASGLARAAPCPVLLVPPPRDHAG